MLFPNWLEELPHNCEETLVHLTEEILDLLTDVRDNLMDTPLPDAKVTYFIDKRAIWKKVERFVGTAVVNESSVIWKAALPMGTSTQ